MDTYLYSSGIKQLPDGKYEWQISFHMEGKPKLAFGYIGKVDTEHKAKVAVRQTVRRISNDYNLKPSE